MSRNSHILWIAILFLVLNLPEASAQLKIDGSRSVNKVTENVSGWAEQAQKAYEESTTIQTMIAYGKGAMEVAKMMQENIAEIKNMVNDTKSSVTSLKDTAMSTVSDITSEAKGLQGDITGAAGGVVGSAAGGVTGAVSAAAAKTQTAQELVKLKNEKSAIESEYKAASAARKAELDGQIKSYEENNAAYQKMIAEDPSRKEELEAKIASNNQAMSALRQQYETTEAEEKAASEARKAEVDSQIQNLRDKVAAESLNLANEDVKTLAKSLFGGNVSGAEMNKMIADNFIPADEPLTSETINKVRNYRNKTAAMNVIENIAMQMSLKAGRDEDNEKTEAISDKVTMMDGSSAALAMDTQVLVENMKAILIYTKLTLANMKMRTAMDLAKLNVYKLRNPDKDVTQFNLDDYKYKKPSKKAQDLISNIARMEALQSLTSQEKAENLKNNSALQKLNNIKNQGVMGILY